MIFLLEILTLLPNSRRWIEGQEGKHHTRAGGHSRKSRGMATQRHGHPLCQFKLCLHIPNSFNQHTYFNTQYLTWSK